MQILAPLVGLAVFFGLDYRMGKAGLVESAPFSAWQVLFSLQVTAWAFLAGAGWRGARALSRELAPQIPSTSFFKSPATVYAGPRLLLLAVTIAPFGVGGLPELSTDVGLMRWSILAVAGLAAVASWPFLGTLGTIRFAATSFDWHTTESDLRNMRSLRSAVQTSVAALGIIIAMHVVAYGAFRRAVETVRDVKGLDPFPEEYVLMYGAVLTVALAAIYWEVFVTLERRARAMIDHAAPLSDPRRVTADSFAARRKLRSEIAAELQLGPDLKTQLLAAVGVLSPLLGALVSGLTGVGS